VPGVGGRLAADLATFVREVRDLDLTQSPSIAEAIDWARALLLLGATTLEPGQAHSTLGVLLKTEQDRARVEAKIDALLKPSKPG
jgi:hypothetical protein